MSGIVVPDGISPEIGWRCWAVDNGHLWSLHQEVMWTPKSYLRATCAQPPRLKYVPRRYGRIVPVGRTIERRTDPNSGAELVGWGYIYETAGQQLAGPVPTVQLPVGWGYELEPIAKEAPEEACACGIYALRSRQRLLSSSYFGLDGAVGSVYLWGKVIPGEDGYRAEYAYPRELWTDYDLTDYGVPTHAMGEFDQSVTVRNLRRKR
jgi:hypothetical protein